VNSTATGGGVAEMLQVLVGYVTDLDIPIGWLVITGDARFFAATKRLHNQIHGDLAGGPLDAAEAHHYTRMLTANAVELLGRIRPGDVALLHDPQTAGLAEPLARAGARVVWRCHIGVGWENEATLFEVNEAFAAQALAVIRELGLPPEGLIPTAAACPWGTRSAPPAPSWPSRPSTNCAVPAATTPWSPCASAAGRGIASIFERI
jgi:hypothetical protein